MTVRVSRTLRNAEAEMFGTLAVNGLVVLYGGIQPASASDPTEEPELVRLPIRALQAGEDGVTELATMLQGEVMLKGKPTWLRVYSAAGNPLCDGSVGTGRSVNLTLKSAELKRGDILRVRELKFVFPEGK